jgi:methyltransferase (TIGR00027 family)
MHKDRPSLTSLLVALCVIIQGGDWYGRSLFPINAVPSQLLILQDAGLLPSWIPSILFSNPVIAKAFRALANLSMTDALDGLSFRKSWIDARVRSALESGNYTNVLIVAAGYDTLAYRLSAEYSSVKFFELDHPATSAVKSRAIHKMHAVDRFHMISGDLTEETLETILRTKISQSGEYFPMHSENTVVVVEGLTYYLTEAQNLQLLREIAFCTGKGSIVLLDHFTVRSLQSPIILMSVTRLFKEPMKFGMHLEDVAAFVEQSSWKLVEQEQKGHECLALLQRQTAPVSNNHGVCYRDLLSDTVVARQRSDAVCSYDVG